MRSLIEDLLLYSVSANENLEKDWVPLEELVETSLSELSKKIKENKATVEISSLPTAACDRRVMGQVFINIISNSLKYVLPGQTSKIRISSRALKNYTKIEFKDNGIGMDVKPNINIFEPFTRLHAKSEYEGSGIGLAICKSICDRHGWTVKMKSEVGKGTTMTLEIPTADIYEE